MHYFATQVSFLAKRLHQELLEVLGKELQPVFIGQNHHVLGSFTVTGIKPHGRKLCGWVLLQSGCSRQVVAGFCTGKHRVNIETLQSRREKPYSGELTGSS